MSLLFASETPCCTPAFSTVIDKQVIWMRDLAFFVLTCFASLAFSADGHMLPSVPHKCRLWCRIYQTRLTNQQQRKTLQDAMKNPKCLRAKLSVLIIWQRLVLASGAPESFPTNLMQKHQLFNPGALENGDPLPTPSSFFSLSVPSFF